MSRPTTEARAVLAYDAHCGPCTMFKRLVSFIDVRHRMEYLSLAAADRLGLLDTLPIDSRYASAQLVMPGGQVMSGAAAMPVLVSLLPAGSLASKVLRAADPSGRIVRFTYRLASRLHDSSRCSRDPEPSTVHDAA